MKDAHLQLLEKLEKLIAEERIRLSDTDQPSDAEADFTAFVEKLLGTLLMSRAALIYGIMPPQPSTITDPAKVSTPVVAPRNISIEELTKINEKMVATLEEIQQNFHDSAMKRQEDARELARLEEELREKAGVTTFEHNHIIVALYVAEQVLNGYISYADMQALCTTNPWLSAVIIAVLLLNADNPGIQRNTN